MAWEQNGCKNKERGSEELLVIDKIITKQTKKLIRCLMSSWRIMLKVKNKTPTYKTSEIKIEKGTF